MLGFEGCGGELGSVVMSPGYRTAVATLTPLHPILTLVAVRGPATAPTPVDELGAGRRALHAGALAALAVAQPVLDLIGGAPTFLVAHRLGRTETLLLAALLPLLVALPSAVAAGVLGVAPDRLRRLGYGLLVAGPVAVIVFQAIGNRMAPVPALAVAAALGIAGAYAALRHKAMRALLDVAGLAFVAIPLSFALRPGVLRTTIDTVTDLELPHLPTETSIVMVVLDELSTPNLMSADGAIDRVRYPNFAALADRATWYRRAVTTAESTELAVPTLLSGLPPRLGSIPTHDDHPRNLFTLFAGTHAVWAVEPTSYLCPKPVNRYQPEPPPVWARLAALRSDLEVIFLHRLLPISWRGGLPPIDEQWAHFGRLGRDADRPPKRGFFKQAIDATNADRRRPLQGFLDAIDQAEGPSLHVLHTLLPHKPWDLLPSGRRYDRSDEPPSARRDRWVEDPYLVDLAFQRHLLQLRTVDRFLGTLLSRLEARGVLDEILLVVTADHGVAFRPGGHRRHIDDHNVDEILAVPLFVKAPGQRTGTIDDRVITGIDLLPTMLDVLAVPSPWPLSGTADAGPDPETVPLLTKEAGVLDVPPVTVDRLIELAQAGSANFGGPDEPFGLYRHGPFGDIVGRPVDDLVDPEHAPWEAALAAPDAYRGLGPDEDPPVLLHAYVRVRPETPRDGAIAVVIDGTIATTAPLPMQRVNQWRELWTLVPDHLLGAGDHTVVLYQIVEPEAGGEPRLRFIRWHRG